MKNWLRMAAAVAVFVGAALVTPQSVFACSGPVLTLEEAKSTATLILAGRVVSNPHEWAYELEVEEVFRGPSSDTVVIGPVAPTTPPICSHQLRVGERVVIALPDVTDLGLFRSAVWHLLSDGSVGTIAPEPPAATHAELFALLRLLPDTSIAAARSLQPLGIILLASGLVFGTLLHVRRGDAVPASPRGDA